MALTKTFPLDDDAGYGFEWLRAALELTLQEGVIGPGDFKVTVAAAGGNRVDVAAGLATVKGDSGLPALGLTQGLYLQVNDAAIPNAVTFDPGDAQPRLDQIVLEVRDSSDLGSVSDAAQVKIVKGAPVAGTTLDNAYTNGSAAALPANCLRLADRLVPAGANTLAGTDLRDRRKWARGAFARLVKSNAIATISGLSLSAIDSATLGARLELTGGPVRIDLDFSYYTDLANVEIRLNLGITRPDGVVENPSDRYYNVPGASAADGAHYQAEYLPPAPGSYFITPVFASASSGRVVTFESSATRPAYLTIDESVRSSAVNT